MKISEVAAKTGVTNRAIRYYEELNLIKSNRLSNNYREYDNDSLDKLKFISRARKLGFSIDECSSLISLFNNKTRKSSEVRKIAIRKREELKKQIKELKNLEKSLEWLIKKCPGNDKPNCPILDELVN
ncbi:MAG: Cu(I)-responsive transcriptional regulator [Pelagibacterales bacterium]|nr:Cu(I)-responsive transcriptional regulator [Pelagibacterales bacterium]PPR16288.1 MAG: HTH-type transcriptional regulator HmrR [Alphaproteobacteria bacterium MarineAlpha9_Bin3]|tara:strand:- start:26763 stop:27146 length:384 start_codon:yes stop_codon:yes gene_type:complete